MTAHAVLTSLQIYGISIVIATLVAVMIKFIVVVTGRLELAAAAKSVPLGEVCPILQGVPDDDVAAVSAAIFAAIGSHQILHISAPGRAWSNQGRAAHHASHSGHARPKL